MSAQMRLLSLIGLMLTFIHTADSSAASRNNKKDSAPDSAAACEGLLTSGKPLARLNDELVEFPLSALLDSNPKNNLAVKHPSIVMDLNQAAKQVVRHFPSRKVMDPTYPIAEIDYYPIFSSGVSEAGGAQIVGQLEAIKRFVDYVDQRAGGRALGEGLLFYGPPGTGKSEYSVIIDRTLANLSTYNPDFYQWTFKFHDLDKIPSLKPAVDKESGANLFTAPTDNPLTLLQFAPELRAKVVALAAPRVRELIGYDPQPFYDMNPTTASVVRKIVEHYARAEKVTEITEENYVNWIGRHVKLVRRIIDPDRPPVTVDFQGKIPDNTKLFASENLLLSLTYGKADGLSWNFDGLVLQGQGRVTIYDEAFRNTDDLLNSLLKVIQSGVVEQNGAPAFRLNTIPVLFTNDESIARSVEEGERGALLNRLAKEPMRGTIHPTIAAKTALWMFSQRRPDRMFQMRMLDSQSEDTVPANINELYTEPDEKGRVVGPEGRAALYYTPKPGVQILVAPRTLEMLGLTVAGTRLVTDETALRKLPHKFEDLQNNLHLYTNVTSRLEVILRKLDVTTAILKDLRSVQYLLNEGTRGISSRDAERWLRLALQIAENRGLKSVTPVELDQAFAEMMTKKEFGFMDAKNDSIARWQNVLSTIKTDFVLPDLVSDITMIVAGERGLGEAVYQRIVQEILALNNNPDSLEWRHPNSGERTAIDFERLGKIRDIFEKRNGPGSWNLGTIKGFIVNTPGQAKYGPLMKAVEMFVLNSELTVGAMTNLLEYYEGMPVSEETRTQAQEIDRRLGRFGYDQRSFRAALRFVHDIRNQLELKQNQR